MIVGIVVILLLLALAVYDRETVAAIGFALVLLLCLQPSSFPPPMIHAGNTATAEDDGLVLVSDGDGTFTFTSESYPGYYPRRRH